MTAANDNADEDFDPAWLAKLEKDLEGLERSDPKVAEAKRKLDLATARFLKQPLPPALLLLDGVEPLPVDMDAAAVRLALQRETRAVAEVLLSGAATEADVARWVAVRLQDFKQGEKFKHEAAFCALVVALEALPTPAAKGFIDQMAASQAQELALLPKVAVECLKARIEAKVDPAPEAMQLVGRGTCHCGVEYIVLRQDGKDSYKHKEPVCKLFDMTGRVTLNRRERLALEARNKK